jgi:hypothetical protein
MAEAPRVNPIGSRRHQKLSYLLHALADYYDEGRPSDKREWAQRSVREVVSELLEDWL